jgi:hypothetical protein
MDLVTLMSKRSWDCIDCEEHDGVFYVGTLSACEEEHCGSDG